MTVFRKYGLGLILISAVVVSAVVASFLVWYDRQIVQAATREARDYYALNLHYRAWNASLGGVYVPTDKVEPNPYLNVVQREVTLADGRRLTLVNPAYMSRMVFAKAASDPQRPVQSKLVSLRPLNPDNSATPWEEGALRELERNPAAEFSQVTEVNGREALQFLGPFITERACLKCHEKQGYRVGDLRGAVSITIPMDAYRAAQAGLTQRFVAVVLLLWLGFSLLWAWLSKHRYVKEMALQFSEERNRTIFEASQAAIFMVDERGVITHANRRMAEMFGYPLPELIGKPYPELICQDERQVGDDRMHQLMRGEILDVSFERHYLRRDGSEFWGHLSGRRLSGRDGRLLALVGVISDINPLRQAIDEVNQAKDYFFSILNSIADPVFVKDENFRLVLVNDAECRLLGRDRSEILGRCEGDFFPPARVEAIRESDQMVLDTGEPQTGQEEIVDGTGRLRIVLSHKSCYVDQAGRRYVVGILRDITEMKALEFKAMRSAQLAAVGELALGVAHEINNPITGVINCAQLLIDRGAVADRDRPVLARIIREGDRVAGIVRSLLFFSRDSGEDRLMVNVSVLLGDVRQLAADQLFKEGIDLQLSLPDEPLSIHANPQQIEQVLINLINNARYALNARGKVDPAPKILDLTVTGIRRDAGAVCRIDVRDNGIGIPEDVLARLGQPFVTTKVSGEGTGLGLSISMDIVKRHGGELRIDSRVGEYTEVTVELPLGASPG